MHARRIQDARFTHSSTLSYASKRAWGRAQETERRRKPEAISQQSGRASDVAFTTQNMWRRYEAGDRLEDVAAAFGVTKQAAHSRFKSAGLKCRSSGEYESKPSRRTTTILAAFDAGKSIDEIASEQGMRRTSVRLLVRRWRPDAQLPGRRVPLDEALLRRRYVEDKVGTPTIAREMGTSATVIRKRLAKLGIAVRPLVVKTRIAGDELRALYLDRGMTQREIATHLGVCMGRVQQLLSKYGIRKVDR